MTIRMNAKLNPHIAYVFKKKGLKIMGEWIICTIDDIGTVVGGGTPSTKKEEYYGDEIGWITPKDLAGCTERYIEKGERSITKLGYENSSAKLLPVNSVLFTSRAPIGYIAIAKNPVCTNQGFKSIVPNEKVDSIFLYYLLKYNKDKIASMGSGTTFKEVSGSVMKKIEVRIPKSLDEQRRIANILDLIDRKIETNNKLNANLEELVSRIFVESFNLENVQYTSINDLIEVRDGTHDSPKSQTDGYPLVTSKHLLKFGVNKAAANKISKEDYDKVNERSKVDKGDILLSMIGTVGVISFVMDNSVDYAIKNVGLFKTSNTKKLQYFTLSYLKTTKITNHFNMCLAGSTQKYISLTELRKIPFPLFKDDEINRYNSIVEPIFLEIKSLNNENGYLTMLRDSLISKLMSGEIDLREVEFE